MAVWDLVSRAYVADVNGLKSEDLTDDMYLAVVDLAEKRAGRKFDGIATYTAELHDGDGTDYLFVNNPPIVSVSALSVDSLSYSSISYAIYAMYVRLKTGEWSEVEHALSGARPVFPAGQQNLSITYVGGEVASSFGESAKYGLSFAIGQYALFKRRYGADASATFDNETSLQGDDSNPSPGSGVLRAVDSFLTHLVGKRVLIG